MALQETYWKFAVKTTVHIRFPKKIKLKKNKTVMEL